MVAQAAVAVKASHSCTDCPCRLADEIHPRGDNVTAAIDAGRAVRVFLNRTGGRSGPGNSSTQRGGSAFGLRFTKLCGMSGDVAVFIVVKKTKEDKTK